MKMKNNKLDEMQEQELLKIEHNGCWIGFWGLLAAMLVQSLAFGNTDFRTLAGEWIVFIVLAVYLGIACARRGIWDRRIPMSTKANIIVSAIAAAALGLISAVMILRKYNWPAGTAAAALITAGITFILCFAVLTIVMKKTAKRIQKLEEEPADVDTL